MRRSELLVQEVPLATIIATGQAEEVQAAQEAYPLDHLMLLLPPGIVLTERDQKSERYDARMAGFTYLRNAYQANSEVTRALTA